MVGSHHNVSWMDAVVRLSKSVQELNTTANPSQAGLLVQRVPCFIHTLLEVAFVFQKAKTTNTPLAPVLHPVVNRDVGVIMLLQTVAYLRLVRNMLRGHIRLLVGVHEDPWPFHEHVLDTANSALNNYGTGNSHGVLLGVKSWKDHGLRHSETFSLRVGGKGYKDEKSEDFVRLTLFRER